MTQRPSLFTLINYCAIVFSFALMFASGWLTACDGFYDASACWLSHMKTINHWPLILIMRHWSKRSSFLCVQTNCICQ